MTIRDKFYNSEDINFHSLSRNKEVMNNLGLTKEQILLKDLKTIAKEYIELEELKNSFVNIVLKNLYKK